MRKAKCACQVSFASCARLSVHCRRGDLETFEIASTSSVSGEMMSHLSQKLTGPTITVEAQSASVLVVNL